jgi:hypothetical protein
MTSSKPFEEIGGIACRAIPTHFSQFCIGCEIMRREMCTTGSSTRTILLHMLLKLEGLIEAEFVQHQATSKDNVFLSRVLPLPRTRYLSVRSIQRAATVAPSLPQRLVRISGPRYQAAIHIDGALVTAVPACYE